MNALKSNNRYIKAMVLVFMPLCLLSCLKNTDTSLLVSETEKQSFSGNLAEAIASGKATLFWQAVKRTGLDANLAVSGSSYTLLVPTDAAMQAAGLTQTVIASLGIDSLNKLVRYHILPGTYGDSILANANLYLQASTLVNVPPTPIIYNESVVRIPGYPLPVFIKYSPGRGLFVNDQLVSREAPAMALNGYLYYTDKVILAPPGRSVYDFLLSQPDLSLYVDALRIVDSINYEMANTNYDVPGDTLIFRKQGIYTSNKVAYAWTNPNCFTIFAPTNAAFKAAGFHTADDIRNFAAIDWNTSVTYQSPMDSMLRRHVVFDRYKNSALKSFLLYADLQLNPAAVNAAKMNNYIKSVYEGWDGGNYMKLRPLEFSVAADVPYIKWSSNAAVPPVPVPANNPSASYPNHFMGHNGVVYKVNTLFFRD